MSWSADLSEDYYDRVRRYIEKTVQHFLCENKDDGYGCLHGERCSSPQK